MQSKLESLIESIVNLLIGMGIAYASQLVIFPWYGINVPPSTNIQLVAWFTLVSLIRSYVLRRFFNKRVMRRFKNDFERQKN